MKRKREHRSHDVDICFTFYKSN